MLLKSFGDETLVVCDQHGAEQLRRGTAKAIQRIFAIRRAFTTIAFAPSESGGKTITNLLLRCVTTPAYVKHVDGRKFIAFLLSIEDIRHDVLDTIVHHLATVRSSMASLYGNIILHAWRTNRADWLADRLVHVAEKAIRAAYDPFASNLRTVLSSFHLNKRLNGIDQLLHRIYTPTLFGNLMVANMRVRSNAITILTEAFPIHDPGATREDIDNAVTSQCTKMLQLLVDPAPSVRRAAIEGVCRALGMYWELVPSLPAKKMIDLIVTKLAFDASSAIVRFACFEGLTFLMENHLAYPVLSVVMRELRPLINDASEKVRLGVVSLLLKVKEKRLPQLRYFDIVPVNTLITRISFERPAVAAKIMKLIVDSYFPVDDSKRTKRELEKIQIKACLSILQTSEDAARYFYRHLNLYIPPGPICEFAMRLSALAIELPSSTKQRKIQGRSGRSEPNIAKHRRVRARTGGDNVENEDPNSDESKRGIGKNADTDEEQDSVCKENLFTIVADLFASIEPSLQKEGNRELRNYVDDIFSGSSLKPFLSQESNSVRACGACWRIASCINPSRIKPIVVYWREELDGAVDWPWENEDEECLYHELLSSMILCALRWNMSSTLLAVVSKWAECASNKNLAPNVGLQSAKRVKRSKALTTKNKHAKKGRTADRGIQTNDENPLDARGRCLCALRAIATVLADEGYDGELCREYEWTISNHRGSNDGDQPESCPSRLTTCIRKGSIGAMNYFFESAERDSKSCVAGFVIALETFNKALKASLSSDLSREPQKTQEPPVPLIGIREALEWLASSDLWDNLSRIDKFFGCSLLGVCLGPIVDTMSLQRFEERDLILLEKLCTLACENLKSEDISPIERVAVEFLRLAIHLNEHATYLDDTEGSASTSPNEEMLRSLPITVVSNTFKLLTDTRTEEGQEVGSTQDPSTLQHLISRSLSVVSYDVDSCGVQKIFGPTMISQFGNDNADESFLASTVCNALAILSMASESDGLDKAMSMFKFLWESLLAVQGVSQSDLNEALLVLTKGVANSATQFHSQRGSAPSTSKEFFAAVEVMFDSAFDVEDGNTNDEIASVKGMLSALQRLEENVMAHQTNIDLQPDVDVQ